MSDPKRISPLLDGYAMGAPMSSHDGVVCCPAMREDSEKKYIVKVISVPASQVQLNALLLTGAYKDPAAATDYFKSQAEGIVKEAQLLNKLSSLEGYLPYDSWQIVPMEGSELGYDVYLISSYKRSLDKFMRRNPMTHLGAVNLGLDLCAALSICRKKGYLYLDLKPTNIFISDDKEYRIGDLGFVPLNSLKYATMPKKYRSVYTAPELHDDMATINTTADIYAVGLILYQIYNNGVLPFTDKAPDEPLPSPLNADYEIAEIIMKACDPDPAARWKSPIEMGQALVGYMQRNVVNDLPINPPLASVTEHTAPAVIAKEVADELPLETSSENIPEELSFLEAITSDDTAPNDADSEALSEQAMTDEVSSILAQADELITHPLPDPFAEDDAPQEDTQSAEEVTDADLPVEENAPAITDTERKTVVIPTPPASDQTRVLVTTPILAEEEAEEPLPPAPKKRHTGLIVMISLLVILVALITGCLFFYHNYYLLKIDSIEIKPQTDSTTVIVNTDIDTSLLTVICSDSYGNVKRSTLTDGQAVFSDLTPDTMYQIQLIVDGFHKLVGVDNSMFTTAADTKLLSLNAVTGTNDGSVVLSFSVEGPENEWQVLYSTEGEEERAVSFTGHSVTITDLTVGSTYDFRIEPTGQGQIHLVGENTIRFTASRILLAQNLQIVSCADGTLTATWDAPADAEITSWNVLCYGDDGYQKGISVSETSATFDGVGSGAYTVEVTADGMTQLVRTSITANAVTITGFSADSSDPKSITVNWDFTGNAPTEGWLLLYSVDGSDVQEVVRTDTNSAVITPKIPNATYSVEISTASANTVFNANQSFTASGTTYLFNQSLNFEYVYTNLLVTPKKANWTYEDVSKNDYTTEFHSGESISVILRSSSELRYWVNHQQMDLMFIIRDADGNVLPSFSEQESVDWYDLWWKTSTKSYHYAELDLPHTPTEVGTYTLDIYLDGYLAGTKTFTITE